MNTRHLVDPELLPLIDAIPTLEFSLQLLPLIRASSLPLQSPAADLEQTDVVRRRVAGPKGAPEVELAIYRPRAISAQLPCIFHMHGGGYVTGKTTGMESLHRALAQAAECCIVSVEYRLAPEAKYPSAVEDCYAALAWVHGAGGELQIDRHRVGVMGESAGGGLAAALALLARDRAEFPLAFQHLIYPMLDDRTCVSKDPHPFAGEYIWTPHNNRFGWSSLLATEPGADDVPPYAAAARAADLSGLPPTFISTGALDLFVEEDMEYARRLLRAGVAVELHVYPGAFHGFDVVSSCPVSAAAQRDSLAALRRFLKS
jgi:acetyl esterase/lipase